MPKNPLSKQLEKMSYNDVASDESIDISVANEIGYKKSDLSIVKIPVADLIEYSDSRFEDVAGRPQPFKEYSAEKLKELSKSIEEYGVLQPISVRPYNGKYQIMAGRNRTRAAILAGKDTVPAIIYPSLAKRKCNLGRVTAKLTDTAFHCIAMSIVVLNLRKLMLSLPQFLKQHFLYFGFFEFSFIQ